MIPNEWLGELVVAVLIATTVISCARIVVGCGREMRKLENENEALKKLIFAFLKKEAGIEPRKKMEVIKDEE